MQWWHWPPNNGKNVARSQPFNAFQCAILSITTENRHWDKAYVILYQPIKSDTPPPNYTNYNEPLCLYVYH